MSGQFEPQRVVSGIPTVTDILNGGLLSESATLVRGTPGAGKTIFGLHFLAVADQPVVYINLGEPTDYLELTADQFNIDTSHIEFLDLSPSGEQFQGGQSYDLFEPSEVETMPLVDQIRVVIPIEDIDELSESLLQWHVEENVGAVDCDTDVALDSRSSALLLEQL